MSKRRVTPTLLVGIGALLCGCQERVTAPSAADDLTLQLEKGGNQGPAQTVTFTFRSSDFSDGFDDLIVGDGRIMDAEGGTTYTGDECGVAALIPGYNGNATLDTRHSKIKPSEEADCDGSRDGRFFNVSFERRLSEDGYDGLPWDGESAQAKWLDIRNNIRAIPRGDIQARVMRVWFDDGHQGGYGWAEACPWGLGYGFGPEGNHSSFVQVKRVQQKTGYGDPVDEWLVKADADTEDDVAVCLGGKSEPVILGYYHVPFEFTIVCEGEC